MKKALVILLVTALAFTSLFAQGGNETAAASSEPVLEYVTGDSWVAGYFAAVLLHNAIDGNRIVDENGNPVWITDLEPFALTAADYDDYKTYLVDDEDGLYTVAETQAFDGATYDEIVSAIYGYNLSDRIAAKKAAAGTETKVEKSGYTVAYNIFGSGSAALDYLQKRTAQALAAYGDDAVLKNNNFNAGGIISDFMEVINSGSVQGVIIWAPAAGLILPIAQACEANGIYFVLNDKAPDDAKEALMGMKYFAGAVAPANAVYGEKMADYAISRGWKTCVVTTSAVGDTSDQPRYDAFKAKFEAAGGKILVTVNNDSTDVSLENVRNALNGLDEEPDFIYGVGSSYALTAITALEDHTDWNTKVITSGLEDDITKLLAD